MKGYKGFDNDFKCRGFQFEVGKEYTQDGEIEACKNGFHACEYPLDVFNYYPPSESRFAEVEQSGDIDKAEDKTASRNIKINAEIGLAGLVRAAVDFTFSRAVKVKGSSCRKEKGAASATGSQGAASATGKNSIAVAWCYQGKARGSLGSFIVCSEWGAWNGNEYPFIGAKMAIVDGEKIKENTFYTLKDGEFVEVK